MAVWAAQLSTTACQVDQKRDFALLVALLSLCRVALRECIFCKPAVEWPTSVGGTLGSFAPFFLVERQGLLLVGAALCRGANAKYCFCLRALALWLWHSRVDRVCSPAACAALSCMTLSCCSMAPEWRMSSGFALSSDSSIGAVASPEP